MSAQPKKKRLPSTQCKEAESVYKYEFFLPQNPKPIKKITGDIYDAEQKADEIATEYGVDVDDLIIAVRGRYPQ